MKESHYSSLTFNVDVQNVYIDIASSVQPVSDAINSESTFRLVGRLDKHLTSQTTFLEKQFLIEIRQRQCDALPSFFEESGIESVGSGLIGSLECWPKLEEDCLPILHFLVYFDGSTMLQVGNSLTLAKLQKSPAFISLGCLVNKRHVIPNARVFKVGIQHDELLLDTDIRLALTSFKLNSRVTL